MLHDELATETSRIRTEAAARRLEAALASKFVRNVDFVEIKDMLSRAWDEEGRALPDRLGRPQGERRPADDVWYRVVHLLPYSMVHVRIIPKRLPGLLKQAETVDDRLAAAAAAVTAMHDRWLPLVEMVEATKAFVVKGRNPSETPAEPRDLDNTGTCSCCQRNVKLKDLRIVDHGFTVEDGRNGNCFGVGYRPIEVSPEGLTALRVHLEKAKVTSRGYLDRLQADLVDTIVVGSLFSSTVVKRDDERFPRARSSEIERTKLEISNIAYRITMTENAEAAWEPRLLPDGAGHFAMPDPTEAEDPKVPPPKP